MSDATTTLLTSWGEREEESLGNGMVAIKLDSGKPHTRAIFRAVKARYNEFTGRERPGEEDVRELVGQKVTLVRSGENMLGGEMIVATEGTIFVGSSHGRPLAIKPKRNRTNGLRLDLTNVLDVIPGYSTSTAQDFVDMTRGSLPKLKEITKERLLELPRSWDNEQITFCAFGTHRLPGSEQADAICMFAEYDDENDILDTGVVLVRPSHGVSEHGSMYGQQLLAGLWGEVVGFQGMTFSEAIKLCELDFEEAYLEVMARVKS